MLVIPVFELQVRQNGDHQRSARWGGAEDKGGVGGRRSSAVFVKTTRRVERDAEFFGNYGSNFRFAGVCVCHLCRPRET